MAKAGQFGSEVVVQIDLDTAEGKAALVELTKEGTPGPPGSPLRVFVGYVQRCASVAEASRAAGSCSRAGDEAG